MAEILSLREAVRRFVHDGDSVALEGFTHLIPTAAGHELIRQGRKDLTLIRMTPDLVYDLLIGAGCAKKLVFSWGGNPGVGSLHRLRDAVEKGWPQPLEIEEHSHADLANAYVAGASGLPFAVLRAYAGSDLPKVNPLIRSVTCPFTGEVLAAVIPLGIAAEPAQEPVHRKRKPLKWFMENGGEGWPDDALEAAKAVREAPSAMNRQPWRLRLNSQSLSLVSTPNSLDTGIALLHMEAALMDKDRHWMLDAGGRQPAARVLFNEDKE